MAATLLAACITAARRPGMELTPGRDRWVTSRVATMRGIPLPESAPVDLLSRQEAAVLYDRSARDAFDEAAIARRVRADRVLGFLTQAHVDKPRFFTLADVGIAGGYDPETKSAFVVNDLEMVARDDRTRAHEVAHILDDTKFNLQRMCLDARGNSDRALAVRALIEGSAMAVALDYTLLDSFEDVTGSAGAVIVSRTQEELENDIGLFARVSRQGRKVLAATPRYLRQRMVFPYSRGIELARRLRMQGGTPYIDAAFENPPKSTEQILHPEKLVDYRDDPAEITLDAAWLGEGASRIHEDTLGEFGIRQLLEMHLSKKEALTAAEGWGGDRFLAVDVKGVDALLWHTEWDTEMDAREFAASVNAFLAKRYGDRDLWMIELGWGQLTRPDGLLTQVRRRGRSVAVADGVPADGDWADKLLDVDGVKWPPVVKPELGLGPLGILASSRTRGNDTTTNVLGGLIASHHARENSSSLVLLGGLLADVNSTPDGSRVSILFGLISWRTAPRQDLFSTRILVSSYGVDNESVAWALLPIINAPGYIRALGHEEVRTGLWNLDSTYRVDFEPGGKPVESHKIGSDGSVILGMFGHGWYDDKEPDGTPVKSNSWYGPFPIVFSTMTESRGPLGPRYAVKPESSPASAPASGPASRERIRLEEGDIDERSHTQILGDLLFSHDKTMLTRKGEVIGSRTNWSLLFGVLASGGARDEQWWFRNPLVGWAELTNGNYMLLFWGFVPILISTPDPPAETPSPSNSNAAKQ